MKRITVVEFKNRHYTFDSDKGVPASLQKKPYIFLREETVFEKGDVLLVEDSPKKVEKVYRSPVKTESGEFVHATPSKPAYEIVEEGRPKILKHASTLKPSSSRELVIHSIKEALQ